METCVSLLAHNSTIMSSVHFYSYFEVIVLYDDKKNT